MFLFSHTHLAGVVYDGTQNQSSSSSPGDPLADPKQCAIDAVAIKDLGANTVTVAHVDPTKSHSECMKSFDDNGIYVLVTLEGSNGMVRIPKITFGDFYSSDAISDS